MIDIITCFCDRDYHLIENFINSIKLSFDYSVSLILSLKKWRKSFKSAKAERVCTRRCENNSSECDWRGNQLATVDRQAALLYPANYSNSSISLKLIFFLSFRFCMPFPPEAFCRKSPLVKTEIDFSLD